MFRTRIIPSAVFVIVLSFCPFSVSALNQGEDLQTPEKSTFRVGLELSNSPLLFLPAPAFGIAVEADLGDSWTIGGSVESWYYGDLSLTGGSVWSMGLNLQGFYTPAFTGISLGIHPAVADTAAAGSSDSAAGSVLFTAGVTGRFVFRVTENFYIGLYPEAGMGSTVSVQGFSVPDWLLRLRLRLMWGL